MGTEIPEDVVKLRSHLWSRRAFVPPIRAFVSPRRELLIKMPIMTVSIVGAAARTIVRIWVSFIPFQDSPA